MFIISTFPISSLIDSVFSIFLRMPSDFLNTHKIKQKKKSVNIEKSKKIYTAQFNLFMVYRASTHSIAILCNNMTSRRMKIENILK